MFNPLDNEALDEWFQRLNAPLKRLPTEDRAELHQEVRQHLEALVAANEELGSSSSEAWEHALTQFGDPARIGKRLAWEWRRGQGWVSPDMAAILYGLATHLVAAVAVTAFAKILFALGLTGSTDVTLEYLFGVPVLVGMGVGRKYPERALAGAFYGALTWPILPVSAVLPVFVAAPVVYAVSLPLLFSVLWLGLTCGAAYLASVTRRGWYRPTLADFKLTLPCKHPQISR